MVSTTGFTKASPTIRRCASACGTAETSLPEASRRRWSGANALIYHKGMLIAALYDLELMRRTAGKNSLEDVYRLLFQRHGPGAARQEGNRAVIDILGSMTGMRDFIADRKSVV